MATTGESLVKDRLSKFLKKHNLHDSIEWVNQLLCMYVLAFVIAYML